MSDHEKIISLQDLIAAGLELSEADSNAEAIAYCDRLLEAINSQPSVDVQFVGNFRTEEGSVRFSVDEALRRALNVRYSELQSITVSSDPIFTSDSKIVEATEKQTPESVISDKESSKNVGVAPKKPDETARPPSPRALRRANQSSARVATIIVSVLVLAVVVVLVVQSFAEKENEPALMQATLNLSELPESLAVVSLLASEPEDSAILLPDSTDAPPAEVIPNVEAARDVILRSTPGYTLIVASTSERSVADFAMAQYSHLGLPTGVLEGETAGGIRYRMAVGVYVDNLQAERAREDLLSQLPEDTWVFRIR